MAEFRKEPRFDAFSIASGRLEIEPMTMSGYSFLGRQVWETDIVVKSGRALGIDARPGDLTMSLRDAAGRAVFYRVLRRVEP